MSSAGADRGKRASSDADAKSFAVRRMRPAEAEAVAELHRVGIPTGVLAELGPRVLARLYRSVADSPDGFVLVAVDPGDRVMGFVSGVTHIGRMYRRVLRRHFVLFALVGLRHAFSPRMLRRIFESLFYPSKVKAIYPDAELLSIVLDSSAHGTGAATALLEALLDEFQRRGVGTIKVMVGADLQRANRYYRKHGFSLAGQVTSHGHPSNIYVIDTERR